MNFQKLKEGVVVLEALGLIKMGDVTDKIEYGLEVCIFLLILWLFYLIGWIADKIKPQKRGVSIKCVN